MIIEFTDGNDYSAPDEFIPGKWYNIGNETFQQGYETDCKRRGQNYQEIRAKMMAAGNDKIDEEGKTPRSPRRLSEEKESEAELEKERPTITKQRNGSQSSRYLSTADKEKAKKDDEKPPIITTTTTTTTTTTKNNEKQIRSEKPENKSDKTDKNEKTDKTDKTDKKPGSGRKKTVRAHSVKSHDPKPHNKTTAKTALSQPVKTEKTSAKKDKKK